MGPDSKRKESPLSGIQEERYWLALNPDLTISPRPFDPLPEPALLSGAESRKVCQQIVEEGYFDTTAFLDPGAVSQLKDAITRLFEAGLMPVFIGVYDQFWRLFASLRSAFASVLGDDYLVVPDYWTWYVEPMDGATGWQPHRDATHTNTLGSDGRPKAITIWIPFTDVDGHNACIYVVPQKLDPKFKETDFRRPHTKEDIFRRPSVPLKFHDVRALTAKAGSVLGWNEYLLHWGGRSSKWARQPRISTGMYLQSADLSRLGYPFDLHGRNYIECKEAFELSFEQRLRIIANMILAYDQNGFMEHEKNYVSDYRHFAKKWSYLKAP